MSKIAFFSIPAYGHTNPTLGVAEALVKAGHEVVYFSFEMFRREIEGTGAQFVGCDDAVPPAPADLDKRLRWDFAGLIEMVADTTLALEERVCRQLRRWGPDCVVSDSLCFWGKFFAQKLQIPYVCSTTTFAFNQESAKLLGQNRGLSELVHMVLGLPRIKRALGRLGQRGYPTKDLRSLLQNDRETDTIVYTSRMFQPMGETFSRRYAFVGPSLRLPSPSEEGGGQPVIYISLGSLCHDVSFYRSCVEALGEGPLPVVMVVREEAERRQIGGVPDNVQIVPWAEQLRVLQHAKFFLSHGGMNSVSESLYFGVPLLLYPQHSEQRTVANRVVELGAGELLTGRRSGDIRAAVERLLRCPAYWDNARRIGQSFRQAGGAAAGAEKILQVIADSKVGD